MTDKLGKIIFQYLPEKYSKCPYCGAFLESYTNYRNHKWEERARFGCGLSVSSKTSIIFEEHGICENSKKWKTLKKNRLKQLERIKELVGENIKDAKLHTELMSNIKTLEHNIKEWWNT